MANCTSCGANNNSVGIRPNLSCPPDLSQLLFRFVERKKLGVVKGRDELALMDMSKFFIPLNGYSMASLNLCSGESKKIESGASMDLGKRREIQEFDINDLVVAVIPTVGATATLNVTEGTTDHGTLGPFAADDYATFITSLKSAITSDHVITAKILFGEDDGVSVFNLFGRSYGDAFTYTLTFDDGSNPAEFIVPTVNQTALRYPNGALKLLMLSIIFCSDCTDSNLLYVEYAFDSDVIANGEAGATWRTSGPMIFLSGAEDVIETDTNKIETIWIRNTRDCDVEIQAILAT